MAGIEFANGAVAIEITQQSDGYAYVSVSLYSDKGIDIGLRECHSYSANVRLHDETLVPGTQEPAQKVPTLLVIPDPENPDLVLNLFKRLAPREDDTVRVDVPIVIRGGRVRMVEEGIRADLMAIYLEAPDEDGIGQTTT